MIFGLIFHSGQQRLICSEPWGITCPVSYREWQVAVTCPTPRVIGFAEIQRSSPALTGKIFPNTYKERDDKYVLASYSSGTFP